MAVTWLERASQPEALLVEETDNGLFGLRDLSSSQGKNHSDQRLETCKEENHYRLALFTDHIRNATRTRMLEII